MQEKSPFLLTLPSSLWYESCMCLSLVTSITTSISSEMASGAGQSSHSTSWTLVGMAPSRDDSQDLVVGRWSDSSSGTNRVQWFSLPPAESHSKEKFNNGVSLDAPWMGQGMPITVSCYHCMKPGWRYPHPRQCLGAMPLPLLQRSHPWTAVHSPLGTGRCQAAAVFLPLAHPDQIPSRMQGFH